MGYAREHMAIVVAIVGLGLLIAAHEAGMQTGDEIVAVDGVPIGSFTDLQRELQKSGAPAERRVEIQRGAERLSLTLKPDKGRISVSLAHVLVRLPFQQAIPQALSDV